MKLIELFEDHYDQKLYHSTYKPLLKSIMTLGLGAKSSKYKWEDSKKGVVYLATSLDVAKSYAETADSPPEEWLDVIVTLQIDASKLDKSKLKLDSNVHDNAGDTLEYHGVIPPSIMKVVE